MARLANRRLKVFQAQFGFFDTVIAAPSQTAALEAWGVHQNLFASGEARLSDDEAAVRAALDHPGIPLRRPVGSAGPYQVEPAGLPALPDPPMPGKAKRTSARARKPASPPPDRSELDAAEAALRRVDDERKTEEAALGRQEAALQAKIEAAQSAYVEARKAASAAVVSARTAYRKAGGAD